MHIAIWIIEGIAFSAFIAMALYFWIRVGTSNVVKLGPGIFILFGMATIAFFILLLVSGIAWLVNKDQSLLLWTAVSNLGLLVLTIVLLRIIYLRIVLGSQRGFHLWVLPWMMQWLTQILCSEGADEPR